MERISLVETHDVSAIERIEEAYEHRRQQEADAANEAARLKAASEATAARLKAEAEKRVALFKAGLGIAVGAVGIGVAALLALWGVSLLSRVPSYAEDPPIAISRGRLQAQPAPASTPSADQPTDQQRATTGGPSTQPVPPSTSGGKTVVEFVVFKYRELDGLNVTTGWAYHHPEDNAPFQQHCYISMPNGLNLNIAFDREPTPIDAALASKLRIANETVRKALDQCVWFSGTSDNIKDKP
jgi:hypothetical protein